MPISWNEIRLNAIRFAHEWTGTKSERAEKQTFWNEFFEVFGIRRRLVATFEEPVRGISGKYKYIDLFWRGMLLVEHKSKGEDLSKAKSQAFDYIQDLVSEGRHDDVPRYIIVSDFNRIALHDLEPDDPSSAPLFGDFRVSTFECSLADLHKAVHNFAFIPGYKQHKFEEQDPINLEAVEIMGHLHDTLEAGGYSGHELERFLVRILFCLFAEDTGIFEREAFGLYVQNRTKEDGSDLGLHLARLFDVLNTAEEKRQKTLDESLAAFPYVNGELFAEDLGFADFDRDMRNALVACTRFDWSRISPAIFGSLFQAVMEPRERRQIGGHYTSERDILKVIGPLFLDELREEFARAKKSKAGLKRFHTKLAALRFLDPACGCGNFLVISYRELRLLEIEVLKLLYGTAQRELNIQGLSQVDVDTFYGIEISEWPARIAEVAMWLMDHQMNQRLSEAFGQYFARLPLKKSPHIVCGNALRLDWKTILPPAACSFILGNPPFVGAKFQTLEQRADMESIASSFSNTGLLDYVTGWYFKSAEYIQGTTIIVGFVSTNSITQGEQVAPLWHPLLTYYRITIHFAHRTFRWDSEARGKAHVHVVIIGFGVKACRKKSIFDYDIQSNKVVAVTASNINPYLIDFKNILVSNRQKPLCNVPEIAIGNKPIDNGNYLFDETQLREFLKLEPSASDLFHPWLGTDEFINGLKRWCLWLGECPPDRLRRMPHVLARIDAVRQYRKESKSAPTRKIAETPTRFHVENMPTSRFLIIPEVSSENRYYIPIGFMTPDILCSNKIRILPDAKLFHFGVLSSAMHMAWVRQVTGRLESRFQYSVKLTYNNFPWPDACGGGGQKVTWKKPRRQFSMRVRHFFRPKAEARSPISTIH